MLFVLLPVIAGWGLGRVAAMTMAPLSLPTAPSTSARVHDGSAPDDHVRTDVPHDGSWRHPGAIPAADRAPVNFTVWDVVLESTSPIAAWQIRATPRDDSVRLAGIEGGAPPFVDPAAYDPAALAGGVVILAAYTLEPPAQLPDGATTVATIHVRERGGDGAPSFIVSIDAASDPDGNVIDAVVSLRQHPPATRPVPVR